MSKCPKCGSTDLQDISGNYETDVVAPDGYRESRYETGFQCLKCGLRFDCDEAEERT